MSNNSEYPIGYSSSVVNIFNKRSAAEKARFLLPYLKETDHLLDCGCGPGSITLDFASLLSEGFAKGIDIEPSQVKYSKKLMEERKVQNAAFQTANILNLPFEDDAFDVAFTHAVLWTVKDPFAAIQELKRVVKPGGIIASREPSSEGLLYYPESKVFEKALRLQFQAQGALGSDRNLGKKLSYYFSQANLNEIKLSVSSDVYSSPEKRHQLAQYSIAAWSDAPWSEHIRAMSWASESDITSFQQALLDWQGSEGAFVSATWCQAIGQVP